MQIDTEQQREVLLAAINATSWQGQFVELVSAVKVAVQMAEKFVISVRWSDGS